MTARRRVLVLTLVLTTVALGVAGVTLVTLYRAAVEGQEARLLDTARSRARLIEAVARFDLEESVDYPGGARAATLAQLRDAHERSPGLGETGEFLVGYLEADSIRYALPQRHTDAADPISVALASDLGEPMRRALQGASGTLIGLDYRGETVLAAHEPLGEMDAGVVAKLDLDEIRAPFLRTGLVGSAAALLLIVLGIATTYRLGGEMASEILELEDLKRMADERLRLAVEGAGLGFWEVDFEKGAWNTSQNLLEQLGYGPEELEPTLDQWQELLHPDDREVANRHKEELTSGAAERYEARYRLRASDGSWRWLHSLGTTLDPEGRRAVGVHRDITEEQAMLDAVQRSEERLSTMVNALPGSLVTTLDREGRYVYVAGEALRTLGLPREELLGRQVGFLVDEEDRAKLRKVFPAVLKGASATQEVGIRGRTLLLRASPIRDADGTVVRVLGLAMDITERKEQERLLHEQREQLDRIMENVPRAVVLVLDEELRVEFMGGEALTSRNVDPTERLGTPVLDWVAPDRRDDLEALFRDALSGKQVRMRGQFPGAFRGLEEPVALEISAGPLRSPDGEIQGILTLAVDISDEWEAREALEATKEKLQVALEAGQHGAFDMDVASGRIEATDLYAQALGYDPETFEDSLDAWVERLHPRDRDRAVGVAEEFLAGEREDYRSQFRQRTASGDWIWVRSVARAVGRDEEGRPTRIIGTHTDITREKEAERTRELLSTAVEQSNSLVLISDVDGVIEYVNPEFERVTGYAAAEVVGRETSFLASGHHTPELFEEMWARLHDGEPFETELVNRRKDGSEYRQQTLISPIVADDGQIMSFVSIARDVTNERAMEEQLRQAQKMEAVGQLTGGIAHDFNNVLTGILSNVRLALEELPADAEEIREEVREVQKAAHHGATLVRKLMAFSRDKHLDRTPMAISSFLTETRSFLARTLPESIDVTLEDRAQGAVVDLDAGAMHQILLNLATNARDAMPEGGTLALRAETDEEEGHLVLEVQDDGSGMSAALAERAFEPFFTTKDEGTGLGLAMVYALTERQDGTVTVESEAHGGTTFQLRFPLTDEAPSPTVPAEPEDAPVGGDETILVVEDEAAVRRAARRILERAGYTVRMAEDGAAGLEVLREEGTHIDLVLTDMVMPGMGGAELWRAASARDDHPPFVFTSGYADQDLEAELGEASESRFLRKPWDGVELLGMIQRVLADEAS